MISTVLFDLEGTLVDFQWKLDEAEEALRQALVLFGFEQGLFTGANYAEIRLRALARAASPQVREDIDRRLTPIYDQYDQDALSRWSLRGGAFELLQKLAARGVRLALVSNIGRRAGWAVLDKFALRGWFQLVIAREDVTQMKPSGEGIRKALTHFGAKPEESLMVGDSLTDLRAAHDAGVPIALISGGETIYRDLGGELPDYRISSLSEVLDVLSPEKR
ncbi:MAG: HAD family hydrolase [Deferrisomatales bacterium]|nr:HAD family hydrolase [Deferrisomatales bacterium]